MRHNRYSELGTASIVLMCLTLATYFCFSAIQGEYGVMRRAEYDAQARQLQQELEILQAEHAQLQNKTRRLTDECLDLDLLDEQVRDVLGLLRMDEVVVQ